MIPRTALALLTVSAIALAACGSDDDTASGSAPTADDLAGQAFESTSVEGYDLVEGSTIELGFETDALGARAGCNSLSGGYTISDGTLEVGAMASTMMACEDALMAQDQWLSEFLTSSPEITLDGGTLTLTGSDATMTLGVIAPTELEGTTWIVSGTVANEAVTVSLVDSEASMSITDGQAQVDTGCNTGSSTVEVTDTTITFGPLALTRMACDEELTRLEASVVLALDGEVTYEISGDTLTIRKDTPDGVVGLDFTAE
ncbi:MAG: META domain-containing protein [Ilumatobacteraceae bacterium]